MLLELTMSSFKIVMGKNSLTEKILSFYNIFMWRNGLSYNSNEFLIHIYFYVEKKPHWAILMSSYNIFMWRKSLTQAILISSYNIFVKKLSHWGIASEFLEHFYVEKSHTETILMIIQHFYVDNGLTKASLNAISMSSYNIFMFRNSLTGNSNEFQQYMYFYMVKWPHWGNSNVMSSYSILCGE